MVPACYRGCLVKIRVLYFGSLAHDLGTGSTELELSDNATVGDALIVLCETRPPLEKHCSRLATAVNLEYVDPAHPLHDGDELALIPPVSGG